MDKLRSFCKAGMAYSLKEDGVSMQFRLCGEGLQCETIDPREHEALVSQCGERQSKMRLKH